MLGRTLGAATVAVLQGMLVVIVCFIAGFRPASWLYAPFALVFMLLIASVFAALGTAIGSMLENMQGFQLIMNFLVMPIFFLSGALYPLTNLPKMFSIVVSADPLAYGVDALRTVLLARSHFGLALDSIVLIAVAVVLLVIGSRLFAKVQV
jgi:ABC-2 type transport system permease protein